MLLEKIYTENTAIKHRKKYAQFFTPPPIAALMADWLLGSKSLKTVLEPAFGLGVFSRKLLQKNKHLKIKGFDIDETIFDKATNHFKSFKNVNLHIKDYMYNDWHNKYDGIICNPPYLKFHDYDNKPILKKVEEKLNFKFNGFTNLYTLFLLKSIFQLKKNGRIAYLIPSEFLNSDYGKLVKQYLLNTKTLRQIFIFDFKENIFDGAMTTASIIFLANDHHNDKVNITTIHSKADLQLIKKYIGLYPNTTNDFTFKHKELDPEVKWRKYYQVQNSKKYKNLVPFSSYAKVMRGIATGANDYFTFKKSKAQKYAIPIANLLPCICKAKDIKGFFFTSADYKKLIEKDALTFLFNGQKTNNEKVVHYIRLGEKKKINEKYLTKNRKPWYALENRAPAPIWVSVFNRTGIKFIRNEANIANLTTFHCVYPNDSNLFSNISIDLLFAYLLTDVAKEIFNDNQREYGNGLKKFEPNDLNKSKMLDLSILKPNKTNEILKLYNNFKIHHNLSFIKKIDELLRCEFIT